MVEETFGFGEGVGLFSSGAIESVVDIIFRVFHSIVYN